jgi:hypothetical protein
MPQYKNVIPICYRHRIKIQRGEVLKNNNKNLLYLRRFQHFSKTKIILFPLFISHNVNIKRNCKHLVFGGNYFFIKFLK